MEPKIAALALAGMVLAGLAYASTSAGLQQAFAHNFTGDESANFIANVEKAKVHLQLADKNLRKSDVTLAHVEHARMHFDDHILGEVAEKNKRVATDLGAAFDKLEGMIGDKAPRADIKKQIKAVNSLLGEAQSARIDKKFLKDGDVQAIVMAQMVIEALDAYNRAFGMMMPGEAGSHGNSHGGSSNSMNATASHSSSGVMDGHMDQVYDKDAYEVSKAFVTKASGMFSKVKNLAPAGSEEEMAQVKAGLGKLRTAVNHKESPDDVAIIVHGQIHENLIKAFDLKLPDDTAT